MSWRDSQRFMRIAAAVRALGWLLAAVILGAGAFAVFQMEGDEALFVVLAVAVSLIVVIALTQVVGWVIEKHAERVVVR